MSGENGGGPSGPSLIPLEGHVILQPAENPDNFEGVDYHPGFRSRYPQAGYCIATASEWIAVDDLCLIEVESKDVARQYQKVLSIHLKDWGTELFDPDVEPAIREALNLHRANPSTKDLRVRVETLNGEHLSFMTSDIIEMSWTTTDSPEFSLFYPQNVRMAEIEPWGLLYFVHEEHILGAINFNLEEE